jgi:hypothetical protein
MTRSRRGNTVFLVLLSIVSIVLLVLLIVLWMRVAKIHRWAILYEQWSTEQLYPWIRNSSFQKGTGSGGDPDPTKPPPAPRELQ